MDSVYSIRKISLANVNISVLDMNEAIGWAGSILSSKTNKPAFVVTPNPEILVEASRNSSLVKALNEADMSFADGTGLILAAKLKGYKIHKITGIDFVEDLIRHHKTSSLKIFIIGGFDDTAKNAAVFLKKCFPRHDFQVASFAPFINQDGTFSRDYEQKKTLNEIVHSFADILIVGFGAPKQELWISKYKDNFPMIKIVIGIGGALDIWAGNKIRAPKFLRFLGLEWAWRFLIEPKRASRMLNALFVFPLLLLRYGHEKTIK
ncbi:MAG: hypothetical protein A3A80_04325 [Candidatus Terrybacteria bacterium RIFCSPLOWO2_01_FULL_44_24]|uniref:Glycosyltransferase n=1 Tax=Candidatus Terrybacteria bacterium RIFCSPHIGHO2_01_FULL_43_35 TaxID=1802361 RepID=A0A1G2PC14_9BACT|nr:MAG: hypothetical protein A2828_01200 [Candidatus Terrybacteria bacterium RIFCSPHIGHO2_01_FULL_43_35]OHA49646.1 MAG: hypothetical protein A3B75_00980 [Candidatus Terrybacteria bacterium RIFCSPHIGHO2_02_FULL_43_14]OHA51311.1 MAG: hypothetical protein A3A80_04325 [Candidatus Terrybacteria bacterium RIFCSPLOWO2_01_FULL_44_24]